MDSQDWDAVHRTLQRQTRRLNAQEEQLTQLCRDIVGMADHQVGLFHAMSDQLQHLSSQFKGLSATPNTAIDTTVMNRSMSRLY